MSWDQLIEFVKYSSIDLLKSVVDRQWRAPGRHRIYNLGHGASFSVREVIDVSQEVTRAR